MWWCSTKSQLATCMALTLRLCNVPQGVVMATRVFDTYLAGTDEMMVVFLNSISEQRILCFAILVSAHLHEPGTISLLSSRMKEHSHLKTMDATV